MWAIRKSGTVMNREDTKSTSVNKYIGQKRIHITRCWWSRLKFKKEIQNRVMLAIKASAKSLEEQSGVKPSLTDTEIRNHLEMVVQELKDTKIPRK